MDIVIYWIPFCFIPMVIYMIIMNKFMGNKAFDTDGWNGLLLLSIVIPLWMPMAVGTIIIYILGVTLTGIGCLYDIIIRKL